MLHLCGQNAEGFYTIFIHSFEHALIISYFVLIMFLSVEYLHVLTFGKLTGYLRENYILQILVCVLLGIFPGCTGSFFVVSLFYHGFITFGALAANMLATCGDEAFVMLALFPVKTLYLFIVMGVISIFVGFLVDFLAGKRFLNISCNGGLHQIDEYLSWKDAFSIKKFLTDLRYCKAARGISAISFVVFILGLVSNKFGEFHWEWENVTLLLSAFVGLFIVLTASDHFIEKHFWQHIVKVHLPRVFLWTFGSLVIVNIIEKYFLVIDIQYSFHTKLLLLFLACLIGIIPESGPNLIFVTLYAEGRIPFGILLANSLVQDGHGALPLLAHSRKIFVIVKLINFIIGLIIGGIILFKSG